MTEHQASAPQPPDQEKRRARVAARLAQLGPGPAAVFADACRLLDHDLQLVSRTMLLFHMLRELESSVREVLVPDDAREAGKSSGDTQKLQVKAILAAYDITEDEPAGSTWLRIVGKLHGWAHRNNLEAPRTVDPATRQLFDDIEDMLDVVLDALDARYLTVLERLDALAALTEPTKADAARLLKELPQNHLTWHTFFTQLVTPAWIAPLNAKDFFSRPPTVHGGAEGQDMRWPATAYLARVATQAPSDVMVIARDKVPDTDNPFVNLDIVEIALALPAASAGKLVPRTVRALGTTTDLLDPARYAALAVRCTENGLPDAAVDLVRALLGNLGATTRDEWAYRLVLTQTGPHLTRHLGLGWAATLADLLDQALAEHGPVAGGSDLSQTFFPSLEQATAEPFRMREAFLIEALRNATRQLLDEDTSLGDVLDLLDAHPWLVFRRLHLHLLEHHGDRAPDLVEHALADTCLMQNDGVELEWRRLARARAQHLPADRLQRLIADLTDGPDTQAWRTAFQSRFGAEAAESDLRRWTGVWRRDRLAAIRDLLPEQQQAQLQTLEDELGPAPSLDEVPTGFIERPEEPGTTTDHLATLTTDQLIDAVNDFKPTPRPLHGDGRYAFAANLETTIAHRAPAHCAAAPRFAELDGPYLLAALNGFASAARAGTTLDWEPLVTLAEAAANRTTAAATELQRHAALLLNAGLTAQHSPEPSLADRIWDLTATMLRTGAPDETESGEVAPLVADDPRAQALRTMVTWARWRRAHGAGFQRLFETLDSLTASDPLTGAEAAAPVAAVIGGRFAQLTALDPDWARDHTDLLGRPGTPGATGWDAYLRENAGYLPAARLLLDQYGAAVDAPVPDAGTRAAQHQRQQLGRHLLHLYGNDLVSLDGGGLLDRYYRTTSDDMLCQLSWEIVASLHDDRPIDAGQLEKVRAWWQWRSTSLRERMEELTDTERTELQHAGPLAASARFPVEWSLRQIQDALAATGGAGTDSQVFHYLADTAADATATAVVLNIVLQMITSPALDPWLPGARERQLRTVLEHGLADHGDTVREIVNRAAGRGHPQFRSVLQSREQG
ncbi:hypothetical protein ACFRMQ_11180 [Kitasatospora sp. NPDC056783]|uniref:hypothetical protein n=1 Tax=Kitasatospora sp. NPDC056783 TaxID=3345943 RepID=UPI00368BA98B